MKSALAGVLGRTSFYALKFLVLGESSRTKIKKEWADSVLRYLNYNVEVSGKKPSEGPVILVGNHVSYIDIPVLLSVFPTAVFVAKDDLQRWPILGFCISLAGTIFISRKTGADRSLARSQIVHLLQTTKNSIVVFPSGTTSLDEQLPWKKGIFEIAKLANVTLQVFRLDYEQLRASAYIDDDNFIFHLQRLGGIKNKKIKFSWLNQHQEIDRPELFAETARESVVSYGP